MFGFFTVLCTPQAIGLDKTVGLLHMDFHPHGICVNKHPIKNFTECIGSCPSSTFFNKSKLISTVNEASSDHEHAFLVYKYFIQKFFVL